MSLDTRTDELGIAWELIREFAHQKRSEPEEVTRAAEMICERLSILGVPFEVHDADVFLSVPQHGEVVAERSFSGKAAAFSHSVPQGVSGAMVYIPAVVAKNRSERFLLPSKEVLAAADIAGKIVLSDGFPTAGKTSLFSAFGAAGAVFIAPGENAHWGSCTPIWGSPEIDELEQKPRIPVVSVSNSDGRQLVSRANNREEATVRTEIREGWFRQPIPVAYINGYEERDRFVLVHGHYDSWDVGVGDNATGAALLLALAHRLNQRQGNLRRSVRIAWWPGHSTGKFAGSTWYADNFALDLRRGCVAHINCDSPGCRWATEYSELAWTAEAEEFVRRVVRASTGLDCSGGRPHRGADYSFNAIGITGLLQQSSIVPPDIRSAKEYYAVGGCGGNIEWHTERDTLDIADRSVLLRDLSVYTEAVTQLATCDILPFDWSASVHDIIQHLNSMRSHSGDTVDMSRAVSEADVLLAHVAAFNEAVKAKQISPKTANTAVMRLQRILIPILYNYSASYHHDPAVPALPLPALSASISRLASADSSLRPHALVGVIRDLNRLLASIDDGIDVLLACLASVAGGQPE